MRKSQSYREGEGLCGRGQEPKALREERPPPVGGAAEQPLCLETRNQEVIGEAGDWGSWTGTGLYLGRICREARLLKQLYFDSLMRIWLKWRPVDSQKAGYGFQGTNT